MNVRKVFSVVGVLLKFVKHVGRVGGEGADTTPLSIDRLRRMCQTTGVDMVEISIHHILDTWCARYTTTQRYTMRLLVVNDDHNDHFGDKNGLVRWIGFGGKSFVTTSTIQFTWKEKCVLTTPLSFRINKKNNQKCKQIRLHTHVFIGTWHFDGEFKRAIQCPPTHTCAKLWKLYNLFQTSR